MKNINKISIGILVERWYIKSIAFQIPFSVTPFDKIIICRALSFVDLAFIHYLPYISIKT